MNSTTCELLCVAQAPQLVRSKITISASLSKMSFKSAALHQNLHEIVCNATNEATLRKHLPVEHNTLVPPLHLQ